MPNFYGFDIVCHVSIDCPFKWVEHLVLPSVAMLGEHVEEITNHDGWLVKAPGQVNIVTTVNNCSTTSVLINPVSSDSDCSLFCGKCQISCSDGPSWSPDVFHCFGFPACSCWWQLFQVNMVTTINNCSTTWVFINPVSSVSSLKS